MAVDENDIKRYRGDTYPLIVAIKENKVPVDLSKSTVTMTIDVLPPVRITGNVTEPLDGKVRFNFDERSVGKAGKFNYNIQVNDGNYTTTYVKALFVLMKDITV